MTIIDISIRRKQKERRFVATFAFFTIFYLKFCLGGWNKVSLGKNKAIPLPFFQKSHHIAFFSKASSI